MKTTIYKHEENNFKKWSKRIVLHLGILASMICNPAFANHLANVKINHENSAQELKLVTELPMKRIKKPALESECDSCVAMVVSYRKTIEEVIAEDNKIIESEMEDHATSDMESIIREDNQIIESNLTNEVFALDFRNS